jgi:uncharacterized repeat protein (TIGR01451 family)
MLVLSSLAYAIPQIAFAEHPYSVVILNHPEPGGILDTNRNFGRLSSGIGDINGDGIPDLTITSDFSSYLFSGADNSLLDSVPNRSVKSVIGDVSGDGVRDLAAVDGTFNEVELYSGADRSLLGTIMDPEPNVGRGFDSAADAGDINGDGVADILVGAAGGFAAAGVAYVFSGADLSLLLTIDDPEANLEIVGFGFRVASIGDVNRDNIPDIAVGAPRNDANIFTDQGKVFVFSGANGQLMYPAITDPLLPQSQEEFGRVFDGIDDIDGDGVPDLLVAAPLFDVESPIGPVVVEDLGVAFVFSGATGSFLYGLAPPLFENNIEFGTDLADIGDIDGDGITDLLIGAPGDFFYSDWEGEAYLFSGKDGTLLYTVEHPVPQIDALFGESLDGVGDINLDGAPDFLIGAAGQDLEVSGQGQAYLFLSNIPLPPTADLVTSKTVNNISPNEGEAVTYTLSVTNNGPDDATDVSLTDQLPLGVSYVSSIPSHGSYDSSTGIWTVGDLLNGASATLQIIATVDTGTGGNTITNTITSVSQTEIDPSAEGDDLTESLSIPTADLLVSQGADRTEVRMGDQITFTLTVQNFGPDSADSVVVTDILSADLAFVGAYATRGSFTAPPPGQTGTVDWALGYMESGDQEDAQLVVTVLVRGLTTITNTADVTSDTADNNTANNTTTLDIAVLRGMAGNGHGKGRNK